MKTTHRHLSRGYLYIIQVLDKSDEWRDIFETIYHETAFDELESLNASIGQFRIIEQITTRRTVDITSTEETENDTTTK